MKEKIDLSLNRSLEEPICWFRL